MMLKLSVFSEIQIAAKSQIRGALGCTVTSCNPDAHAHEHRRGPAVMNYNNSRTKYWREYEETYALIRTGSYPAMTLLHFINCVGLASAPYLITYRFSGL